METLLYTLSAYGAVLGFAALVIAVRVLLDTLHAEHVRRMNRVRRGMRRG